MRTISLFAILGVAGASFLGCSGSTTSSSPPFSVPAMCRGGTGGTSGAPGGGTADGDGLSATLCASANVALHAFGSKEQLLFQLSGGTSTFQTPSGASDAVLFGSLGVTAAKPGTYASSDLGACGSLSFVYALANPPGLDCSTASTPSSPSECPKGCSTACSGLGCEPCTAAPPQVGYGAATGTFDCDGNPQGPSAGSWTLTLTSVTKDVPAPMKNPPASSPDTYTVHGTLAVDMAGSAKSGGTAGSGTVQLALEF